MINNDKLLTLFKEIQNGENEIAFSNLFDYCFPDLMRFAYSYIKSRSIAEEIASDVLLDIWKKKGELQPSKNFRLYLYVSARNKAFNQLRRKNNIQTIPLEDTLIWSKAVDSATPENTLITNELRLKIKEAIQQLPAKCRLIYKLIKEDGLKYKETAALLELSQKTIEAQMGIAMKRLFSVFSHYIQDSASKDVTSKTQT